MKKIKIKPRRTLSLAALSGRREDDCITVEGIEIDLLERSWHLTLCGPMPTDGELLTRLQNQWQALADGPRNIALSWALPETTDSVETGRLLEAVQGVLPAAGGLLCAARLTLANGALTAQVASTIAMESLLRPAVRGTIEEIATQLCSYPVQFNVELCSLLRDELDAELTTRPAQLSHISGPEVPAKERVSRTSNRRRSVSKITDLEVGSTTVSIEGEIFKIERRQLNSGKLLTTLWVTDFEDSIQAKHRCKTMGCCDFKVGDTARVTGTVTYDRFAEESVINARAVEATALPSRQDESPVKRVELHLHSKMSSMDGLCSPDRLFATLAHWGHEAVAITDHGVIQAFPHMHAAAKKHGIKLIFGMEGYLIFEEEKDARRYHIIMLAQNETGLRNLYQLVSRSHLDHFYRVPRVPLELLQAHREGILLGTACQAGELYQALLAGADEEQLEAIATRYDYLEIHPLENNAFLVVGGQVGSMEQLAAINRRLLDLGDRLNKPVVATGDVHFLDPTDDICRRILLVGQGYSHKEQQAPLYLQTTAEMLERMSHLGEEDAFRVVVKSSRELTALISDLNPLPTGLFPPVLPQAADQIYERAVGECEKRYGQPLPPVVQARLEKELQSIIGQGYAGIYAISSQLVARSRQDGYLVGSRGSVGSSLVATMCGITEVNPLPPHYQCNQCKYVDFLTDGRVASGFDMPSRACPHCGQTLLQEGQDIPFETFMGFDGDKVPDIDLNFSGEYQAEVHRQAETILGDNRVYRAGTIATLADKTAYGFVKGYVSDQGLNWRRAHIDRMVGALTGVKRTTGQHPGGLMIVPAGFKVEDFSPVQYPADDRRSGVITTHFDYQAVHDNLVKLDLLGHDDPTSLRMLQDLTGVDPLTIPFDDPPTLAIFSGMASLGLSADDWDLPVGTAGIPEFGTRFVRKMLMDTKPRMFSELVRVSGLSHGTDVWLNNAQELITKGMADISQVISSRDDITVYLIYRGISPAAAFSISEAVRKGRGLTDQDVELMEESGIPDWYIHSCRKIKYLFPKAHAVAYVMMAFRIAYFKVHHPLAFYATYFSIRASSIDGSLLLEPKQWVERLQDALARSNALTARELEMATHVEVAIEMQKRGFGFLPPSLYVSDASRFTIEGNNLLIPFGALPGLGQSAAQRIIKARDERPFLSVDDLRSRTRLSKNLIELLQLCGCLSGLPERNQISLFAEF